VRARLAEIRGIGPWTVEYIAMRALRDPDAFPASDLGLRSALSSNGRPAETSEAARRALEWRPWRAYAAVHLWESLAEPAQAAA
jgi:AraC family transcriptional regulator of adaptative response / DNA-3-methyladenine glycosylase II